MSQKAIDLILANAAKLRRAGVVSLSVDGFAVTLAPHELESQPHEHEAEPVLEYSDPLLDPDTYPGGKVPKFAENTDGDE